MTHQLTLPLNGDVRPKPLLRTDQQERDFQSVLANLRDETQRLLNAAISLSGIQYAALSKVPTPLLKSARESVFGQSQVAKPASSRHGSTEKPYKAWSLRRKYGERCKRLITRVRKSSTFWYAEELQDRVLESPEYYGVCPLPAEKACTCKPEQRISWMRQAEAIARENSYRA